jgi:hypothetical protein
LALIGKDAHKLAPLKRVKKRAKRQSDEHLLLVKEKFAKQQKFCQASQMDSHNSP